MCCSNCDNFFKLKMKLEKLISDWEKKSSRLGNTLSFYDGNPDRDMSIAIDYCIDDLQKILEDF